MSLPAKIHLKAIEANGTHTRVTVFMNGGNCGTLTMREDEAIFFHHCVMMSTYSKPEEVISSGKWEKE